MGANKTNQKPFFDDAPTRLHFRGNMNELSSTFFVTVEIFCQLSDYFSVLHRQKIVLPRSGGAFAEPGTGKRTKDFVFGFSELFGQTQNGTRRLFAG